MMVYRDETSSKDDDMLDIIEVELLKKPGRGLGLSIVGRRNGPGVYISDVVRLFFVLFFFFDALFNLVSFFFLFHRVFMVFLVYESSSPFQCGFCWVLPGFT